MKAIISCSVFLLICISSWGQQNHADYGKSITFANVKDKARLVTFLNYKKVYDTSQVCRFPDIHVDYDCLYQVTISEKITPPKYFYVYVGLDMNNGKKYISVDTNTAVSYTHLTLPTILRV